jgi:hypothetical protein
MLLQPVAILISLLLLLLLLLRTVVEFETREEAERARDYMDGGQLDGAIIQ